MHGALRTWNPSELSDRQGERNSFGVRGDLRTIEAEHRDEWLSVPRPATERTFNGPHDPVNVSGAVGRRAWLERRSCRCRLRAHG